MKRTLLLAVTLVGCGRIAFDPLADGAVDVDAPPDVALGAWNPPSPVLLPVLGDDDDPTLTADLLELYFNRGGSEILRATRSAVGQPWGTPVRDAVLSSPGAAAVPEVSGDGLTMYFATTRGTTGTLDIFVATRALRTDPWSTPVGVSGLDQPFDEFGGSTTEDGLLLLLTTDEAANADLHACTRTSTTQPWSAPSRLPGLATPAVEDEPFISLDGLTLYYSGPGFDLYVTRRASRSDPFEPGTAIPELSSSSIDRDPWVSPDGRYMIFSSDRSGQFALWEATR